MRLDLLNKIIPKKWLVQILFYAISIAFMFLNAWLLLKKDIPFGVLIPFLVAVIVTAFFAYDKLIWLIVLLTPLSVPLSEIYWGLPIDMALPTEPLLVGVFLLFIFSVCRGKRIDKEIVRHPIALVLYFYLGWMALTTITSTLPLVSLKFLFIRVWYIVVFFFLLTFLFKKQQNMEKFIWLFTIAFIPVIIYTIIRHLGYGLYDNNAAHWVMDPFFNDHTSYGAVLAMYIPFLVGFTFSSWVPKKLRFLAGSLLAFFLLAEVLSFSRAAWLSLFASMGVWVIIKLKIKFRTIAITVVSVLAIVFVFQDQLLMELEKNSTDSSNNLMEHFSSMTNISTDASNLERINRWQCAIAMFKEKPFLGWGPGTYAMKYAPYQLTSQRTIISTNYGTGGNAHSEYLGAMAESGFIGTISFVLIIIVVLYVGIRAYTQTSDKRLKTLLLSSVLALITYYMHSFLNNFLDTDKASVPFWGFTAIIVAIDLYIKKEKKALLEK